MAETVQQRFRAALVAAAMRDAITWDCWAALRRAEEPAVAAWIAAQLGGELPSRPEMGVLVGAVRVVPVTGRTARFALPGEPDSLPAILVPLWPAVLALELRVGPPSAPVDATVIDALAIETGRDPGSAAGAGPRRWWSLAGIVDFLGYPD